MKYAYYPGCSLGATGKPYDMSSQAIMDALDLDMPELDDWNCCGSSAFQTIDEGEFLSLSGRNLALAEKNGNADLVTPCSGCFFSLQKTNHALNGDSDKKQKVDETLGEVGLSYDGDVRVRHLLDVLVDDVGLDAISERVVTSLDGLKAVCYYGCLLTRPPAVSGASRPENPVGMDRIVEALGGEALDWSFKTECCGAAFALSRPEIVEKLTGRIMDDAREVGAEIVVVACPLCQNNLDMQQSEDDGDPIPIVYFTELMGLAFGLTSKAVGLGKHFKDPAPALCRFYLTGAARAAATAAASVP